MMRGSEHVLDPRQTRVKRVSESALATCADMCLKWYEQFTE